MKPGRTFILKVTANMTRAIFNMTDEVLSGEAKVQIVKVKQSEGSKVIMRREKRENLGPHQLHVCLRLSMSPAGTRLRLSGRSAAFPS